MITFQTVANPDAFEVPIVEWGALSPLLIMALAPILLVTVSSVVPSFKKASLPTVYTAGAALLSAAVTATLWSDNRLLMDGALTIDRFTLVGWLIIAVGVAAIAMLLDNYIVKQGYFEQIIEWNVLLMISAAGGMIVVAAQDLIVLFVGIEVLSIATYVLVGLHLRKPIAQEAAFKYFILGAVSSGVFAYGIALVYGATGSTYLSEIATSGRNSLGLNPVVDSSLMLVGIALMLGGFAFKVGAAPFHSWTPDVYQGAPTPITAYMASAVKVAAALGFARVMHDAFGEFSVDWQPLVSVLAVLSLVAGSFIGLAQKNLKRILAYSSINHVGFILIAIYALDEGVEALLFYSASYAFTVIGSFGILMMMTQTEPVLAESDDEKMVMIGANKIRNLESADGMTLDDLAGASKRHPLLAGLFAVLLFSQAGVPFTVGFWAKLQAILAAVSVEAYLLAGFAILAAVVAAVLYLRIVVAMYLKSDDSEPARTNYSKLSLIAVVACVLLTVGLGIYPEPLSDLVTNAGS